MRILYLTYYFFPHVGGGTWATHYFAENLQGMGYDVTVLAPRVNYAISVPPGSEGKPDYRVLRTPKMRLHRIIAPFLGPILLLARGLKSSPKPGVVLAQYHPHHFVAACGVLLSKLLQVPCILRIEDIWREGVAPSRRTGGVGWVLARLANYLNEQLASNADAVIVVCSEWRDALLLKSHPRFAPERVLVTPNGHDPESIGSQPSRDEARAALGVDHQQKLILFLGRYSGREYGLESLIASIPKVVEKVPEALFVLAGDDPARFTIERADSLGRGHLRLLGPLTRNQVASWLAAADMCIGPLGPTQTVPLKIIEYLVAGKIVITGKGSLSRDLRRYHSLFATFDSNKDELAQVIMANLLTTRGDLEDLRRELSHRYSWPELSKQLARAIEQLAPQTGSTRKT